jgi:hypothetical protein
MRFAPRSSITKGKLGGMDFMYNPTDIADSQSVTWSELSIPGASYPYMRFSGGNTRVLTFSIYLNDKVSSGITNKFIKNLEKYLPSKGTMFKTPATIRFAFGAFVADCKLASLDKSITKFSNSLVPIEATLTVTLNVIQY